MPGQISEAQSPNEPVASEFSSWRRTRSLMKQHVTVEQ